MRDIIISKPIKGCVLYHPEEKGLKYIVLDIPDLGVRVIYVDDWLLHEEPDFRECPSKDYEKVIEKCKGKLEEIKRKYA